MILEPDVIWIAMTVIVEESSVSSSWEAVPCTSTGLLCAQSRIRWRLMMWGGITAPSAYCHGHLTGVSYRNEINQNHVIPFFKWQQNHIKKTTQDGILSCYMCCVFLFNSMSSLASFSPRIILDQGWNWTSSTPFTKASDTDWFRPSFAAAAVAWSVRAFASNAEGWVFES